MWYINLGLLRDFQNIMKLGKQRSLKELIYKEYEKKYESWF